MTFTYAATVAWDPIGKAPVKNVSFQAYAMTDTSFTTPLAITDSQGSPLSGNIINSGSQGVFPEFQNATNSVIRITDPTRTYVWTVNAIMEDGAVANFIQNAGSQTSGALSATYVSFKNFDGSPVVGKHVEITLTADGTDIDNIRVVTP